jgi:hypothetical protein
MNTFTNLLKACGLSNKGAAYLLNVRPDTIRNWKYGKCRIPDGVMLSMEAYAKAAKTIFNVE